MTVAVTTPVVTIIWLDECPSEPKFVAVVVPEIVLKQRLYQSLFMVPEGDFGQPKFLQRKLRTKKKRIAGKGGRHTLDNII